MQNLGFQEIGPRQQLSGGSIAAVYRLTTPEGTKILKCYDAPGIAVAEQRGLNELTNKGLRTPHIYAHRGRYLLLEDLGDGRANLEQWRAFGKGLAKLHQKQNNRFGAEHDNYIATLKQNNSWTKNWPEFWVEQRLRPLLAQSPLLSNQWHKMLEDVGKALEASITIQVPASLLHGDLWSGNAHQGKDGVALIDPASYYGDPEIDLAMMRLFGGFPPPVFDSYHALNPPRPQHTARLPIYQLYYVLVHVVLFGRGYLSQAYELYEQSVA